MQAAASGRKRRKPFEKNVQSLTGLRQLSVKGFLILVTFLIMASWLPDGIKDVCTAESRVSGGIRLGVAAAIILGFLAYLKFWPAAKSEYRVKKFIPLPVRLLVVFLSPQRPDALARLRELTGCGELSAEFFDSGFNSWKMPLAAIRHHLGRLERVFVVTSKETHGLFTDFHDAMKMLFPRIVIEELTPEGIDFEDIREIYELLDHKVDDFVETYSHQDVLVDITSGKTSNSIAGAMITLVEGRAFQYISTTDYGVYAYDVVAAE